LDKSINKTEGINARPIAIKEKRLVEKNQIHRT